MHAADHAKTFHDLQVRYATSLLRDHFSEVESFGDLHAILSNKDIGPFLCRVKLQDVLAPAVKSQKAFTPVPMALPVPVKPKRNKPPTDPQTCERAKRLILFALSSGPKSTSQIAQSCSSLKVKRQFVYDQLKSLCRKNLVHRRRKGKAALSWLLGPESF